MPAIPGWAIGTALGVTAGSILPARVVSALSVALFGMFLAIIIPPSKKNPVVLGCVCVSFAASWLCSVLPLTSALSEGMRTILLTILIASAAAVLFPEEGIRALSCEELNLSYRHSLLTEHPEAVVLYAEFELTPGDPEAIRAAMRELMAKRKASQPLEWPSAGSTFKRPEGHFAGTLIDQCGLKGLTVGGAQVSEKHAGFLINRGGATFADMTELIRQVQQRVLVETGVTLEPEVKIVK